MITRTDFSLIDAEIKNCVQRTFTELKEYNINHYALFLSEADYNEEYEGPASKFNPNVIDSRTDRYEDETRLQFLTTFLSDFYKFPPSQIATKDDFQQLNVELMIYTHIWESKPFLKKMYRLAHLINRENYAWKVNIPPMGKHKFIINDIRKTFEDNKNNLCEIIRNGFHTSLRNAFAHSEYSFDEMNGNKRILLYNYGGDDSWELKDISFDVWSRRFVYSALLSYHLLDLLYKKRKELVEETGNTSFQIKHPKKTSGFDYLWINYDKERDGFSFANN